MSEISDRRTLHRLIYSSRIMVAPEDLDDEVASIIRASIRNNREVSITGLLLIHAGCFLQALEGPAAAVMTTYDRICRDPRQSDAKSLSAGPVDSREFARWNMCARRITPADDAILETLSQHKAFEPEQLSGVAALRLLTTIGAIQSRTELSALA